MDVANQFLMGTRAEMNINIHTSTDSEFGIHRFESGVLSVGEVWYFGSCGGMYLSPDGQDVEELGL